MTDQELIREAIRASGLSSSAFARDVLGRDPRSVRRWKAGSSKLPAMVRALLERRLGCTEVVKS
jgi:DNA-binding transcriptional regulator YiaG